MEIRICHSFNQPRKRKDFLTWFRVSQAHLQINRPLLFSQKPRISIYLCNAEQFTIISEHFVLSESNFHFDHLMKLIIGIQTDADRTLSIYIVWHFLFMASHPGKSRLFYWYGQISEYFYFFFLFFHINYHLQPFSHLAVLYPAFPESLHSDSPWLLARTKLILILLKMLPLVYMRVCNR